MAEKQNPLVGIVMGSDSDWPVMKKAVEVLKKFGVPYEVKVISAHRTPLRAAHYSKTAADRGIKIILAGAGMAAHLAGSLTAHTVLLVIGVPINSSSLSGLDALLATVQMPPGVPVATVGIDQAGNAAILAVQVLALSIDGLSGKLKEYKEEMAKKVGEKEAELIKKINAEFGGKE